ncbi:MAG: zinc-dependent metalloprotease [Gemmatimonadaceae bacterium]|nr:zinc-dependent metalloprotease [Gemmatimonadaceae bacterium]
MTRFPFIAARGAVVMALVGLAGCSSQKPTTSPTLAPSTRPAAATGTPGPTPSAPTTATPNGGTPTAGAGGNAGAGEPAPRPYTSVITPRARTRKGLFSTHVQGSRLYFEIPSKELGKDMMLVASLKGTPAGIGIRGTLGNNALLRFERKDNRVLVRAVNYRNVSSDTANRINRAMPIIQYYPIIAAFNVEAYGQDSAAVIDVTRMFTGGVQELTALGQRVAVDPTRSFIERAVAFTNNVEVEASQTFTVQAAAGPAVPAGFGGAPPAGATTELYHFSIVKLPEDPMQPRFWDERVIWFRSAAQDFGSSQQRVPDRVFINRWRLVKKDPNAALSEPVKPITYYVDPATPLWLQPWVKKGIEEWQPAFEQAGFKNAIVAKDAPSEPEFSGEDASVSMVRWLPTPVQNAVGPSTVDPRTGEILDADVQMYHNIMSLQRTWYFTQVGHLDPRAQSLQFPDTLMGRLIQFVVAHEVGHTLGFPHNMKASSMYPLDSIRNASFVRRMGHSPSIMDYARFNYVAQPEDNIALADLTPRVGTYDTFAVKWGYSPIPGAKTPEAEKPTLDAWARMQDTIPWFRSADDRGIQGADPGEVNEAVGDADAVRATEYGIRNLKRLAPMVERIGESIPGEDFSDVADVYNGIVGQWRTELGHVTRIIGGVNRQTKATSQKGDVYVPVSGARQRTAMKFLLDNAFETPNWLLDPGVLRKIEPSGSIDRIGNAQAGVLSGLVSNDRMVRMIELDALPMTGDRYTLPTMLTDLRRGLWSEIYAGKTVDAYRRRLQRVYLEAMAAKINPPAPNPALAAFGLAGPSTRSLADFRGLLRAEMTDLSRELTTAMARTSDRATRAHLEDARDQIRKMLDPK